MAVADSSASQSGEHGHHDHHGPEYLAHHFESTEQQYDAGKLGIWIFLVTEILFFSGLFCAYTLYRYHHPEIFTQASEYLDTAMGAINTLVLLFSSLTMAWAVRCAQTENRKGLVTTLLITIVCASIFLGIKAVEYTHKWDLGIFVRSYFDYAPSDHHGPSSYLFFVSLPFGILAIVFLALGVFAKGTGSPLHAKFFGGMFLGMLGYFIGVGAGLGYEPIKEAFVASEDSGHGTAHAAGEDHDAATEHSETAHSETEDHSADGAEAGGAMAEGETVATVAEDVEAEGGVTEGGVDREVGIFFSIYYFMTGLHGFHVIGGIIALSWLFFRALRGDFYSDYFGAVDNVGLYWHLVDLVWIYLFPLLYLIGG